MKTSQGRGRPLPFAWTRTVISLPLLISRSACDAGIQASWYDTFHSSLHIRQAMRFTTSAFCGYRSVSGIADLSLTFCFFLKAMKVIQTDSRRC
ncbi:hypothetical protein B0H34DRAFT_686982 [Crassisporium funariophilum]|nr:hypothetical protein B0H34DRAFT_686982 [Crassisporium funariophilum]